MAEVSQVVRQFNYGGRLLADPNPLFTPEEVIEHYAFQHPKLLGGKVITPRAEGDHLIYEFRERDYGDRG